MIATRVVSMCILPGPSRQCWYTRKDLYMALIGFLKRVGVHEISKIDVIFKERIVLPKNDNLLTLSFKGPPPRTTETASSLSDGLRRLIIQSDTMMRGALNNRQEFQDKRGLPGGTFVKHAMSRLDGMSILIIGPEDLLT
ncbi:hypothetical protein IAQ61_009522 [Plenodomus lingam]|uniref:uncharacterized protein n=1 Tax=Leptosphaeria maculans TaxID=5022 RepID=UPI003317481F|nr:hypothetical protein IAQ61_009522 [Plenodomus lingam]